MAVEKNISRCLACNYIDNALKHITLTDMEKIKIGKIGQLFFKKFHVHTL